MSEDWLFVAGAKPAEPSGIVLSVVVPVYNSAATLPRLLERLVSACEATGLPFELIFVEDGGTDTSWQVLRQLAAVCPVPIRIVQLGKNFGQHAALLCGFTYTTGDWVITIDDDLQTPPEEIIHLLQTQRTTGADLVYGIYRVKQHSLFRNLGSALINWVARYSFQMQNSGSSFRLIRGGLARLVAERTHRFVFVDGLLHWHTRHVAHVWVKHQAREHGRSGYSLFKLISLTASMLFHFTTLPLTIVVAIGLLFSVVSFAVGIVYFVRKLIYGAPMGYTSTVVGVFFMGGITLLVLGVIGQYLSRLLAIQASAPSYSVRSCHTSRQPFAGTAETSIPETRQAG
jgi:undecaprenyl-phosphate 4-deoxy-4-formamido-L-arabinose transferase